MVVSPGGHIGHVGHRGRTQENPGAGCGRESGYDVRHGERGGENHVFVHLDALHRVPHAIPCGGKDLGGRGGGVDDGEDDATVAGDRRQSAKTPVLPGWGTQNEMCLAGLFVVPNM